MRIINKEYSAHVEINGEASELNPGIRYVDRVTTVNVIAAATTIVTVSYWN